MSKSRLEAFSDSVFAVAATLLVLQIHVPQADAGHVWDQLVEQWPGYITYAISFLTVGIIWVNHHALIGLLQRVDRTVLFLNLLLLMTVSLCSFTTALVGQWIANPVESHIAASVYGGVFALMGLASVAIWTYAVVRHDLVPIHLRPRRIRGSVVRFGIGSLICCLGIGVAFISGPVSLGLYALVSLYYVGPVLPTRSIRTIGIPSPRLARARPGLRAPISRRGASLSPQSNRILRQALRRPAQTGPLDQSAAGDYS